MRIYKASPRRLLILTLVILSLTACAITKNHTYTPLVDFVSDTQQSEAFGVSIDSDLSWVRRAPSTTEAMHRLEKFLGHWNRDVEDGYTQLRVDVAILELARVYYILGKEKEGDRLLRKLDPLQLN